MTKLDIVVPISNLDHVKNILSWNSRRFRELQLIIIHDAVLEECEGKCRELISKEDAVIVECGEFGNPGSARNAGLEFCSSEWVSFADSDDFPDFSEILFACDEAESKNKKFICGRANIRKISTNKISRLGNSYWEIAMNPGIWRFVFKRSSVLTFRFPRIHWGEDQVFIAKALNVDFEQLYKTDRILYEYRVGIEGQLTTMPCYTEDLLLAIDEELVMLEAKSLHGISKRIVPLMLTRKIATYVTRIGIDEEVISRMRLAFRHLNFHFIVVLLKYFILTLLNKIKLRVL